MTQPAAKPPQNLFGLDRTGLEAFAQQAGEPRFRAKQLMTWLYRKQVTDFAGMTDISKAFRARLPEIAEVRLPTLEAEQTSADGTRKWVLRLDTAGDGPASKVGGAIETVYIPEANRGTLCISSQVGCALDCAFCSTAQQGLQRNLTAAEIVSQVWFAQRTLGESRITNVVFMGMGEPLANYTEVITAIRVLQDDLGFGLSKRRVTVSTSGLVPFMDRLASDVDIALAVSLHAPNDALRDELVPINRKYPLEELMAACDRYVQRDRKMHVTYEYVMLDGVNDGVAEARELASLLKNRSAKVNLIPFNPFPDTRFARSPAPRIKQFSDLLRSQGILTTTRRTRGDDIDAACGQLVGRVANRQRNRLSAAKLSDIPVQVSP